MPTFEFDGRRIPFLDPSDWTIEEAEDVEVALGKPLEEMSRMRQAAMTLAVSIRRQGIDFEYLDALKLPLGIVQGMQGVKGAAAPAPAADEGAVLSPTSAGSARRRLPADRKAKKATPRKRAASSSPAGS